MTMGQSSSPINAPTTAPIVFETAKRTGVQGALCIAGGVVWVLFILGTSILFGPAKKGGAGSSAPGIAGGTSVLGVFLIARGALLLRRPLRVVLDDLGVRVDGYIASTHIAWSELRAVSQEDKSEIFGGRVKQLTLVDHAGKSRATIPATIGNLETLAAHIGARIAAGTNLPSATSTAAAADFHKAAGRKKRRNALALSCVLLAMFGTTFGFGVNEALHLRRFATEAVVTDARIVKRQMVSVTPRIEYSFRDAHSAAFSRDTSMTQAAWDALDGEQDVMIEYLASDPSWNRLKVGEADHESLGGNFLFLSGGLTLFALSSLALAISGYDLRTDEKGKLRFLKFGAPPTGPVHTPPPPSSEAASAVLTAEQLAAIASSPLPSPPPPVAAVVNVAPASKPIGLIALGVIAIVFGVLGAGRAGLGLLLRRMDELTIGDRQLVMDQGLPRLSLIIATLALAILLIIVGYGLVRLRRWSRGAAVVVATLQILGTIATIAFVVYEAIHQPDVPGEFGMELRMRTISAVFSETIGAAFPIVMLVLCARRSTRDALERVTSPANR